ncbi:hypothetical protein PSP6_470040 [Paraburkholderia tropica]|nr:hypothetical protein PSP6_470040 [Paraburkholderia tropica]
MENEENPETAAGGADEASGGVNGAAGCAFVCTSALASVDGEEGVSSLVSRMIGEIIGSAARLRIDLAPIVRLSVHRPPGARGAASAPLYNRGFGPLSVRARSRIQPF